jgi:hypothetical protein
MGPILERDHVTGKQCFILADAIAQVVQDPPRGLGVDTEDEKLWMIEAISASAWSNHAWVDESIVSPSRIDLVRTYRMAPTGFGAHLEAMAVAVGCEP